MDTEQELNRSTGGYEHNIAITPLAKDQFHFKLENECAELQQQKIVNLNQCLDYINSLIIDSIQSEE